MQPHGQDAGSASAGSASSEVFDLIANRRALLEQRYCALVNDNQYNIAADPQSLRYKLDIGWEHLRRGDHTMAKAVADSVMDCSEDEHSTFVCHMLYIRLYRSMGRPADALRHGEMALECNRYHKSLYLNLAQLLRNREPRRALAYCRQARLGLPPSLKLVECISDLSALALQCVDLEAAEQSVCEAASLPKLVDGATESQLWRNLAEVAEATGHVERSAEAWAHSLECLLAEGDREAMGSLLAHVAAKPDAVVERLVPRLSSLGGDWESLWTLACDGPCDGPCDAPCDGVFRLLVQTAHVAKAHVPRRVLVAMATRCRTEGRAEDAIALLQKALESGADVTLLNHLLDCGAAPLETARQMMRLCGADDPASWARALDVLQSALSEPEAGTEPARKALRELALRMGTVVRKERDGATRALVGVLSRAVDVLSAHGEYLAARHAQEVVVTACSGAERAVRRAHLYRLLELCEAAGDRDRSRSVLETIWQRFAEDRTPELAMRMARAWVGKNVQCAVDRVRNCLGLLRKRAQPASTWQAELEALECLLDLRSKKNRREVWDIVERSTKHWEAHGYNDTTREWGLQAQYQMTETDSLERMRVCERALQRRGNCDCPCRCKTAQAQASECSCKCLCEDQDQDERYERWRQRFVKAAKAAYNAAFADLDWETSREVADLCYKWYKVDDPVTAIEWRKCYLESARNHFEMDADEEKRRELALSVLKEKLVSRERMWWQAQLVEITKDRDEALRLLGVAQKSAAVEDVGTLQCELLWTNLERWLARSTTDDECAPFWKIVEDWAQAILPHAKYVAHLESYLVHLVPKLPIETLLRMDPGQCLAVSWLRGAMASILDGNLQGAMVQCNIALRNCVVPENGQRMLRLKIRILMLKVEIVSQLRELLEPSALLCQAITLCLELGCESETRAVAARCMNFIGTELHKWPKYAKPLIDALAKCPSQSQNQVQPIDLDLDVD